MGSAQGEENMCNNTTGTFTDPRDGKVYKTVKIGNQVWMAENLAYDVAGSICYDEKYGRLYKWKTAIDAKTCPIGWHLPSFKEWMILIDSVDGEEIAGERLKTTSGWDDYKDIYDHKYKSGNGTDNFGFSALPSSYANANDEFIKKYLGEDCRWWCIESAKTPFGLINWGKHIRFRDWPPAEQDFSCSIRCVQD